MYSENLEDQLKALHHILIYARSSAYNGVSSREMASILDDTEYLVTRLFSRDEDRIEIFWRLIHEMPDKHPSLKGLRTWADHVAGEPALVHK